MQQVFSRSRSAALLASLVFVQLHAVALDGSEHPIGVNKDSDENPRTLEIPLFPSPSDTKRQGFLRLINRDSEAGTVQIAVFEDRSWVPRTLVLEIGGDQSVHINSGDLENGNPAKGLQGHAGYGPGDWRLSLETTLNIEALSYIRTPDGFLTAMHDVVPGSGSYLRVPTFNPARNTRQRSLLRLINPTSYDIDVTIVGVDDNGRIPGGEVRFVLQAAEARTLTAAQLELGDHGLEGKLGVGSGKWQLFLTPAEGLIAVNLLESPNGHLSNLSTTTLAINSSPPPIGPETGFGPPRAIDPRANPSRIRLADLNGDGSPDLLIASIFGSGSEDRIAWYENTGEGDFSSMRTILTGAQVRQVSSADLDGDGDIDVFYTTDSNPQLAWIENLGNGQFGRPIPLLPSVGRGTLSVIASDGDGDGDVDLLLGWGPDDAIEWMVNLGNGRFSEARVVSNDVDRANAFIVSDLDSDGDHDILVGSLDGDGVSWIENQGRGYFASPRPITTHPYSSIFAADLDGDGDPDLIKASRPFGIRDGGTLAWHENLGGAVFSEQRLIDSRTFNVWGVSAIDLDGDGDWDLAVYGDGLGRVLAWYENFGDAHFSTARIIETHPIGLGPMVFVDLNADTRLDLIASYDHGLFWYDNLGLVSAPTEAPTQVEAFAEVGKAWVTWKPLSPGGDGGSPLIEYRATAIPQSYGESRFCTTRATRGCTILGLSPDKTYDVHVVAVNRAGVGPESGVVAVTPLEAPTTDVEFLDSKTAPIDVGELSSSSMGMADLDGDGDADLLVAEENGSLAWHESANGTYANRQVIHRFPWPFRAFTADIDMDGRIDILTAARRRTELFLFRNLGNGSFAEPILVPTQGNSVGILHTADIDGDSDMDIVSTVEDGGWLMWHENTGGRFLASNTHLIPTDAGSVWSVLASDTDADGDVDLVYRASAPDSVIWRENKGGGMFGSPQTIVDDLPRSIELQDLDGDGDQDLFTTFRSEDGTGTVAWYQNMGEGSFVGQRGIARVNSRVGYRNMAATADIDRDGDVDVVYASHGNLSLVARLFWAENLGSGSFSPGRHIGDFADLSFLIAADVNGDANPDVVVASKNRGEFGWFENKGRVTTPLGAPRSVRAVSEIGQLWVTWSPLLDADSGGATVTSYEAIATRSDGSWAGSCTAIGATGCTIVNLTPGHTFSVSVAATNRKGTGPSSTAVSAAPIEDPDSSLSISFGEQRTITTEAHGTRAVTAADLDGDGDPDVVSASVGLISESDETEIPKIAWYENLGDGAFSQLRVVATDIRQPETILAADINQDGSLDLLTNSRRDGYIVWIGNQGGGTFSAPQTIASEVFVNAGLAVADISSDGKVDVVSDSGRGDGVDWFEILGGGRFADARSIVEGDDVISAFHTEDFDGDGDPDVLFKTQWGQFLAWRENLGSGTFGREERIASGLDGSGVLDAADLDGDGDLDALALVSNDAFRGAIAWYKNLGGGTFSGQRIVGPLWSHALHSLIPIDLDGDGDIDVLTIQNSRWVTWFENLGGGMFTKERQIGRSDFSTSAIFATDLDGDGRPDVLSGSRNKGVVGWYRNLGHIKPVEALPNATRTGSDYQP